MTEPDVSLTTSFPKSRIKVLLLENIHGSAHTAFEREGYHLGAMSSALGASAFQEKIRDVHVLGIRSKSDLSAGVLECGKRLLAVGCFCIGTNQVDLAAANRLGVPVFNAPFSNTRSVAELIIGEVIVLARQLSDRAREVHAGQWAKGAVGSHEIRGKTLGIVGYGHIGSQVGVLAEAMGMRVIFFDVMTKLPMGNNRVMASLDDLLGESDFVTVHVPDTAQTRNLIDARRIAKMKVGSYLLNASRGSVVAIPALAEALRSNHLAGAAVDVFPEEPASNNEIFQSELRGLSNVILTPHIGGSTLEAQESIGREVSTSLIKFVNSGATTGAVNFPQLELPPTAGAHRILNVHRNVPGVLRDINKIVSDMNANIRAQVLSTDANIGYLVMDLDHNVSDDVCQAIASLETSIRTRILY